MKNSRLKEKYNKEIIQEMKEKFGYANNMAVPKLEKILISTGIGKIAKEDNLIKQIVDDLALITGQKAVITKAKKSISNFKSRKGMPAGVKVTLRKEKMYDFMDRFVNLVLPRIRDFKGIAADHFDRNGNITIGIKEQIVFPEINLGDAKHIFGLEVTIVTSAVKKEEAEALLRLMGFPFSK